MAMKKVPQLPIPDGRGRCSGCLEVFSRVLKFGFSAAALSDADCSVYWIKGMCNAVRGIWKAERGMLNKCGEWSEECMNVD